jgi:hypothetical protein
MNQVEPQEKESRLNASLERLYKKAEIDLNRNRKTQEQLNLAFFGFKTNFKNLKQEKIIKLDGYKNLLYSIENCLKLLKEYKIEEFNYLKNLKEIKGQLNNYKKPLEPKEPPRPESKVYELKFIKKQD